MVYALIFTLLGIKNHITNLDTREGNSGEGKEKVSK